jgi:hypothetical protein
VLRRLAGLVVILALAVRALIPAGFMLAPADGADQLSIVICTGHGAMTVPSSGDGDPNAPDQGQDTGLCPFAASLAVSKAIAVFILAAPPRDFTETRHAISSQSVSEARRWPVPPARAPPSLG